MIPGLTLLIRFIAFINGDSPPQSAHHPLNEADAVGAGRGGVGTHYGSVLNDAAHNDHVG